MNGQKLIAALVVGATMLGALLLAKQAAPQPSAVKMTDAASAFLSSLTPKQRARATFPYDDVERLNWHYIPRPRKGLPLKATDGVARDAANKLIASGLSDAGIAQVLNIMSLEDVLYLLEGGDRVERRQRRDPENYFLTVFGTPDARGTWGWRLEGHHISLNYSVADGRLVATTPEFFGANPALIDAGPGRSIRVLGTEEDLAREILKACTPEQRKAVLISEKAPDDIPGGGAPQPDRGPAAGLAAAQMSPDQQSLLKQLLAEYLRNMPADVRAARDGQVAATGFENIRFAWWGSANRNERHAYRVQGPTFVIEYNNTQNNANHAHSVWRNLSGDFNQPAGGR